jgi:hypothetical protein
MYATNAQKQAAYRQRNRATKPPTQREMISLAYRVARVVGVAAMEGNEVALRCQGRNAADTLERLADHFENWDTDRKETARIFGNL